MMCLGMLRRMWYFPKNVIINLLVRGKLLVRELELYNIVIAGSRLGMHILSTYSVVNIEQFLTGKKQLYVYTRLL